jgi:hypothetical protein
VSVARPTADNDKKRSREEVRTRRSNASGDRRDYSHGRYGHDSLDRQVKAPRLSNYVCMIINMVLIILVSLFFFLLM